MTRAYARDSDPSTSHDAADSLSEPVLTDLQLKVVDILRAEPFGMTVPDIANRLNLPRDTISPRMKPLVESGVVVDSGLKARPAGHTRMCILWRLAP